MCTSPFPYMEYNHVRESWIALVSAFQLNSKEINPLELISIIAKSTSQQKLKYSTVTGISFSGHQDVCSAERVHHHMAFYTVE